MEEFNQIQQQTPIQSIERPTAATVFGIMGIVFGFIGLISIPIVFILPRITPSNMEETGINKGWQTVAFFIRIGFSIWILVTGIGLLKMTRWARRSAIIYSCITLIWALIFVGMTLAAISQIWVNRPQITNPFQIVGMIGGICGILFSLLFPILMLIFMLTAKVKQAFAPLESGQASQKP